MFDGLGRCIAQDNLHFILHVCRRVSFGCADGSEFVENAHDAVAQPIKEICYKNARSMPIPAYGTINMDYECKVFSSDCAGLKELETRRLDCGWLRQITILNSPNSFSGQQLKSQRDICCILCRCLNE
jgi:hypothetical protein